jgi:hypothetical protein
MFKSFLVVMLGVAPLSGYANSHYAILRWSRQAGQKQDIYFFCHDSKKEGASPDKRRKYDEAFKAEALRLAGESRSTQAAAR